MQYRTISTARLRAQCVFVVWATKGTSAQCQGPYTARVAELRYHELRTSTEYDTLGWGLIWDDATPAWVALLMGARTLPMEDTSDE